MMTNSFNELFVHHIKTTYTYHFDSSAIKVFTLNLAQIGH